jgi:hypothetical protein
MNPYVSGMNESSLADQFTFLIKMNNIILQQSWMRIPNFNNSNQDRLISPSQLVVIESLYNLYLRQTVMNRWKNT